jgi:hypothetical protein
MEEGLDGGEAALGDPDPRAMADDQPPATKVADGKPDVVAEHCGEPSAGQQRQQMQLTLGRERGAGDQHGLSGQRQAERLEQQGAEHRGVAVAVQIGRSQADRVVQLAQWHRPEVESRCAGAA